MRYCLFKYDAEWYLCPLEMLAATRLAAEANDNYWEEANKLWREGVYEPSAAGQEPTPPDMLPWLVRVNPHTLSFSEPLES